MKQCLGSGSVGSATFWLPGSRTIFLNANPEPGSTLKLDPKHCRKEFNQ